MLTTTDYVLFASLIRLPALGELRRRGCRWVVLVLLGVIVTSHSLAVAPPKEVRRILILNELGTSYPGIEVINQGIQTSLHNSPYQLEFYSEYMDTVLFPDPAAQQEFRDFYLRKYRNRKLDVIITVGPSPLKFMREVHQSAFAAVPIVFCLPNLTLPGAPALESGFTGVENDMTPAETVEVALRLQPGTKHVVVVSGVSDYDKQQQLEIGRQLSVFSDRVEITYLTGLAMPDMLERLRHLPSHSIVLVATVGMDAVGHRFKSSDAGPLIAEAANAPIFSIFDMYLNHGEVGGYVSSISEQGKAAGAITLRILNGEKPQDIPTVKGVSTYMFDGRALKRWGFKETDLPRGSIVLNRRPTLWESSKWYIIGSISLILLEALLISGLLWQRATRRRAELNLRESEGRFRLVANTAPVMIWMSATDKLCNYFNQPWLDFTGRSIEAELGNGWAEMVHPEDFQACLDTYQRAFDRHETFQMEYRLRRHDGEYRWLVDIGVPRLDPDGSFAGYIGSCIDVTDRKLAEEALATVGRRLIEAHEEERTWIGRELHDDINQRLALLAVELDQWKKESSRDVLLLDRFQHAQQRISEIAMDVQALSHRLHSSKLDYLGLAVAAKSFCRELSEKAKVEIAFSHAEVPSTLPKEVSLCLFRVMQEALQNAVKYSGVQTFKVDLRGTQDSVELTIADSGRGFEEHDALSRQGLGLISMRERIQIVHGELKVQSKPGSGTTIYALVPLKTREYRAVAS